MLAAKPFSISRRSIVKRLARHRAPRRSTRTGGRHLFRSELPRRPPGPGGPRPRRHRRHHLLRQQQEVPEHRPPARRTRPPRLPLAGNRAAGRGDGGGDYLSLSQAFMLIAAPWRKSVRKNAESARPCRVCRRSNATLLKSTHLPLRGDYGAARPPLREDRPVARRHS
ncbi:MAG: hypothetical protein RLZZ188_1780 [Verrucomicrobiota bacterium]